MKQGGYTLLEVLVVLAIVMTVIGAVGPSYRVAKEQTNVDGGCAMLMSIWHAQRLHWLETKTYAPTLQDLVDTGDLDAPVVTAETPFAFAIESASDEEFEARATRQASDEWSGTLVVDQRGVIGGFVESEDGKRVEPPK